MSANSSPSSQASIDEKEKEILNQAARLAAYARRGRVASTQINNMLEFLNSLEWRRESLLYLVAYVMRQGGRAVDRYFATAFRDVVLDFYKKGYGKREAVRLLGVMK